MNPAPAGAVMGFTETVDAIAVVTTAVPGVVRLGGGSFGEVATYLPGRRVTGIRMDARTVEVHVVVGGRVPIPETVRHIRAAVAALVNLPVHVHIEDIILA